MYILSSSQNCLAVFQFFTCTFWVKPDPNIISLFFPSFQVQRKSEKPVNNNQFVTSFLKTAASFCFTTFLKIVAGP